MTTDCRGGNGFIEWHDLTLHLQKLNEATRNNLVLVVAACQGFASILASTSGPVAPCIATVGPVHQVDPRELLEAMKELYRGWMDPHPKIEDVAESASRELVSSTIEVESFAISAYEAMVEMLIEKTRPGSSLIDDPHALALLPRKMQKHWDRMFMVNLYPENQKRFSFDVRDLVRKILRARGLA